MADLVKPKEDGGCAVDEDIIFVPGSKLTGGESEKTELSEKKQHAAQKISDGSLSRGNLSAAMSEDGASETGEKAKLVSEASTDPRWSSIGSITRGFNENSNWAIFSPVTTAPNSHSIDTSDWAQNLALNIGETPVVTSNNQTVIPERENPDVSVQVSDSGSPGWQAFSLGGDDSTTWSETVPRDRGGTTPLCADSTAHPLPSVHRTDDLCQIQTPSVCTASLHPHNPPLTVFRQCFASSVLHTGGEEREYEGPTECTRSWERIRNSRWLASRSMCVV